MQAINDFLMSVVLSVYGLKDRKEDGQTLVEYALIIALIAVVLVGALTALQGGIGNVFSNIKSHLS